jgi:hypothetical protein
MCQVRTLEHRPAACGQAYATDVLPYGESGWIERLLREGVPDHPGVLDYER